jgi:thioredoxin-related protein
MRQWFVTILLFAAVIVARASDKIVLLKAGNTTYTNITVTSVSATDVYFTYGGGMGNAKLKDLSPELQQHFGYDSKAAKAVADQQATNQANYQQQLAQQPVVKPPDMSRTTTNLVEIPLWQRNLNAIIKQAHDNNRFILFDFTGSDWCPGCLELEANVFSTKKFRDYAAEKLIFIRVDFPHHIQQPDELKQANQILQSLMHVQHYPTCAVVDGNGKLLGGVEGYSPGEGPDQFIATLEQFMNRK